MRSVFPEMSVGYLGSALNGTTSDRLLSLINSNFASESTSHPQSSYVDSDLLKAASHRGIVLHPWTYTTLVSVNTGIRMGVQFLTANSSEWLNDQYSYLVPAEGYTLKQNIAESIAATAVAEEKGEKEVNVEIMRIGGDDITFTSYDNGTVAADKEGTATVILKYKVEQFDGSYTIYSAPVTVTVEAEIPPPRSWLHGELVGYFHYDGPNIPGHEVLKHDQGNFLPDQQCFRLVCEGVERRLGQVYAL